MKTLRQIMKKAEAYVTMESNTNLVMQGNNYSCLACAACMAVGHSSVDEFYDFVGHDGSYESLDSNHPANHQAFTLMEVMEYLINNGVMAFVPTVMMGVKFKSVKNKDLPAIVVTESNSQVEGGTHAMYWTGKRLLCPRNGEIKGKNQRVVLWIPLVKTGEIW